MTRHSIARTGRPGRSVRGYIKGNLKEYVIPGNDHRPIDPILPHGLTWEIDHQYAIYDSASKISVGNEIGWATDIQEDRETGLITAEVGKLQIEENLHLCAHSRIWQFTMYGGFLWIANSDLVALYLDEKNYNSEKA